MTNDPSWIPGVGDESQVPPRDPSAEARARLRASQLSGPTASASRPEIVYLDPRSDRPVSPYSPEGEIRMMGEFASGLARSSGVSRPMAFLLVAIILLPILVGVAALITTWL
jgi:hypothetical protein